MQAEADVAAIVASGLFDLAWFRARNPRSPRNLEAAVAWFLAAPSSKDLDPGPGFSSRRYLRANPDVEAAGINALLHFLRHGRAEGRASYAVVEPSQADLDLETLRGSALFDADFYLDANADVRDAGIDPLEHYLRHGAGEGRWPNPWFDPHWYRERHQAPGDATNPLAHYATAPARADAWTSEWFDGRYYRARYPDADAPGLTPLEHFLRHGVDERRETRAASPAAGPGRVPDPAPIRATVVVAVHDAPAAVYACLDSVLRHSRFGAGDRLVVIDDASTDPGIGAILARLDGMPGVAVVRNETNIGYTRTANLGLRLAGDADVALLNSDTVVGPHWLRNLKIAAYRRERIGSVTAVSDNAGAFSVPREGDNAMPPGASFESLARAVADARAADFEVPTGNGFCMYLRRAMLDEVGQFDEEAFPVGYGEENDLSMRAIAAGWHHLVCPTVFVHHERSASFGARREALAKDGAAKLQATWPRYADAVKDISRLRGFVLARYLVARRLRALQPGEALLPRRRILYVISTRNGGIPRANADLMQALADSCDCLALRSDRRSIELLRLGAGGYEPVETHPLPEPIRFATHVDGEYEAIVRSILVRHSIDLLHVRHLAWHSLNLARVARDADVPVVQSFHDYYSVCPTVNLVDRTGRFHPRGVAVDAAPALWPGDPASGHDVDASTLQDWQDRMQRALAPADAFVTTSESARTLLQATLPLLAARAKDFHVVPHGRDFDGFRSLADDGDVGAGTPMRVLLAGNIGLHKGSELVRRLAAKSPDGALEFHLLGTAQEGLASCVVDHGPYARDEFAERVASIRPHVAAILSLAAETWCHTLTECWAAGIPVLAIDRGALGERLRRHGGGWPETEDVDELHARLMALRDDAGERAARIAEVHAWQRGAGRENGMQRMADRYLRLYESVMERRRSWPSLPGREPTN